MKKPERVGPYVLLSLLGDRSRSHTWLASVGESASEPKVALKLARPKDARGRARILYEVAIAGNVDHPNIVRIHECGEADGVLWVTTAYVSGPHQPLKLANFRQLLLALVHIHANDVIHADLDAANLLLDEEGDLRLSNFANARHQGEAAREEMGAPQFMSPEQLRGEPLDTRSDLFAAGVVLYWILTGSVPFEGNAAAVLRQHGQPSQRPPSAVAPGLGSSFDDLVEKALARSPEARFGSAFAFLSAFDAACKRGVRPAP